jgi:hypothetical protein
LLAFNNGVVLFAIVGFSENVAAAGAGADQFDGAGDADAPRRAGTPKAGRGARSDVS